MQWRLFLVRSKLGVIFDEKPSLMHSRVGCGIGSLLRMFWVLLVITFRSYRHDPVVEEMVIFEEVDDEPSPPPVYADEKVISAEEKQTSS